MRCTTESKPGNECSVWRCVFLYVRIRNYVQNRQSVVGSTRALLHIMQLQAIIEQQNYQNLIVLRTSLQLSFVFVVRFRQTSLTIVKFAEQERRIVERFLNYKLLSVLSVLNYITFRFNRNIQQLLFVWNPYGTVI